jgi:KEOPS complex subunit Cgi121
MIYEIAGARGQCQNKDDLIKQLKTLGTKFNITLQLFDARLVYGQDHIRSAIVHADRALANRTNLADDIAIEIMLYASGERQIKQALVKMGLKEDTDEFGFVLYSSSDTHSREHLTDLCEKILGELQFERDDSVLDGNRSVLERFGIPNKELETIPQSNWLKLILERVAMVDIIK